MSPEEIELRSEEMEEILGRQPGWILRWGVTVIFVSVLTLLVGSYLFKFPDIINSSIVVTTENIPATIVSKTNGKITALFVTDKQKVSAGQLLAIIENPTDFTHLYKLKALLDTFKLRNTVVVQRIDTSLKFTGNYSLGELQSGYSLFLKSYADYIRFIETGYYTKKIAALNDQISKYNSLILKLRKQTSIMEEQMELCHKQFSRDSGLYATSAISAMEIEKSKAAYLQSRYSFETARAGLDNTQITISQTQQAIMDLEQQYNEQKKQLGLSLSEAFNNLYSQVGIWEQNFVLKSPIEGTVTFTKFWSINQNVQMGDNVLTVVPDQQSRILGKILLPLQGAGKVKTGQMVNIKFDNFPYMEYGTVRGIVKTISLVPNDSFYSVEVEFPDGLKTNYGKALEFSQQMQGSAEIITEDVRLIERFVRPLKYIIKKQE